MKITRAILAPPVLVALLIVAGSSAGCSSHDPSPKSLYAIDPGKPTAARDDAVRAGWPVAAGGTADRVIEIRRVNIAPPFDGQSLTFRARDGTYVKDGYNQWVAPPEELLSTQLADWLSASGPFASVVDPRSSAPHRWALETCITSLYGDFQNPRQPRVILRARLYLLETAGDSGGERIAYQNHYDITLPLEKASPQELVQGSGRVYRQFLESLTHDLSAFREQAGNEGVTRAVPVP